MVTVVVITLGHAADKPCYCGNVAIIKYLIDWQYGCADAGLTFVHGALDELPAEYVGSYGGLNPITNRSTSWCSR